MPQFDFYAFSGQSFWALVSFFGFYFFILFFYLVNFAEMFKMRQKVLAAHGPSTITKINFYNFFLLRVFKA